MLRRLVEELGKASDVIRVGVDRRLREVAQFHVIDHALSEFRDAALPGSHRVASAS